MSPGLCNGGAHGLIVTTCTLLRTSDTRRGDGPRLARFDRFAARLLDLLAAA